MTSRTENSRTRAKKATRRALLQAGIDETIERGGIGTPVIEAICKRAGYTRGAFYAHFRDRTDFVVAMMESVLRDVIAAVFETGESPGRSGADLEKALGRLMEQLATGSLSGITNTRALYLGLMEAVQRSPRIRKRHARFMEGILETLETAAREGQKRREIRRDVPPREVADIVMLVVIGLVMWERIEIPLDVRAIRDTLLRLVTREPLRLAEWSAEVTRPERPTVVQKAGRRRKQPSRKR